MSAVFRNFTQKNNIYSSFTFQLYTMHRISLCKNIKINLQNMLWLYRSCSLQLHRSCSLQLYHSCSLQFDHFWKWYQHFENQYIDLYFDLEVCNVNMIFLWIQFLESLKGPLKRKLSCLFTSIPFKIVELGPILQNVTNWRSSLW